jgi:hypothetical protein
MVEMTLLKNGFKQDFERLFQVHPIKFKNKKKALLNLFKIGQKRCGGFVSYKIQ